ncbi:hypothetical protein GVN16_16735 [Emticicia sp. CRIBPO]|uniref:hypothetical protein n=1 Tax=Emticicia sp. CRIBPO TaxID=2683258 RepID=UPI001412E04A|nr:hypothetical protein [Emticicia sp. CRIBPO]NBA87423.1 hypothetical protein [Emticicia sp. CRIBPO]
MKKTISIFALVFGIMFSSFAFDEPVNKERRKKKKENTEKEGKKEKKKYVKACGVAGKH